ncbi:FAD-dependent oxidoreductase [Roseicyclus sp.]|jgi:2-polyprenyl-6-methoxyphenol hydroxylase-like FAD-dependent oxidoreductase|uniref:FAD-dependent oxidoreductase n=1 Tax=Roseicyclus sp. TaxID=1914329 RepID=UPI000ACAC4F9|nr:FAD-dependent monooxygenase [Pseudomonadota bacterium]
MPYRPNPECEVAIAGAGPVGLTLAYLLSLQGISVVVVERAAGLTEDLRASTFHPPTLDMLDTIGLGGNLVSEGLICPDWQIRLHPSGERAVFDLSVLAADTAHPYRLQCEQWKLSRLLMSQLTRQGTVDVRFGTAAAGITQDDLGVSLEVETGETGERETIRARFVIGADGARSFVREAVGLDFTGRTYPETTLLVTTTFPFEDHLEGLSNVSYCWRAGGNFSLLKVPGRWRISVYPREDAPIEDQMQDDAIEAALQVIVARPDRYDVLEKRPYRVHQRIVPDYRAGRVVLAGDAAHLNNPSGGMGLNGGIHDAFELSAALQDMLRGTAGPGRLDLYTRRRRPVASEQILMQADRNRARMRERDPAKRREILAGLQEITADREKLRDYLLRSSMIEGLRMAARVA